MPTLVSVYPWNEIGFHLMLLGEQNQLMMEEPKLCPLKEKIVNMNTINSIDQITEILICRKQHAYETIQVYTY